MSRQSQLHDQAEEILFADDQLDVTAEDARGIVEYLNGQDYGDDATIRISVAELHKMLNSFLALHRAHKRDPKVFLMEVGSVH